MRKLNDAEQFVFIEQINNGNAKYIKSHGFAQATTYYYEFDSKRYKVNDWDGDIELIAELDGTKK